MPSKKTIEEIMIELESIVKKVDEEDIPIDEIVKIYECSAKAIVDAKNELQRIVNKIETIAVRIGNDTHNG